jgi:hypothetical protein
LKKFFLLIFLTSCASIDLNPYKDSGVDSGIDSNTETNTETVSSSETVDNDGGTDCTGS